MGNQIFLGIDIGGTKSAAVLGTAAGVVSARVEIPTCGSAEAVLEELADRAEGMLVSAGGPAAAGVVCGSPLDAGSGIIQSPPNLPGWDDIPVTDFFSRRFGCPVRLMNDANAGALAEWRHGAGKGCRNLIFCTMGTGFGCGLILNGGIYEGGNGNAGEIGHVRLSPEGPEGYGKAGSVEGWCSGGGMARLARSRMGADAESDAEGITAKQLGEAAERGDLFAQEIFAEVGRRLGEALAVAVDLLNPECIILGSIFVRQEARLRPSMEEVLRQECLPQSLAICRIVPAALGEQIGDIAALCVARMALEANRP